MTVEGSHPATQPIQHPSTAHLAKFLFDYLQINEDTPETAILRVQPPVQPANSGKGKVTASGPPRCYDTTTLLLLTLPLQTTLKHTNGPNSRGQTKKMVISTLTTLHQVCAHHSPSAIQQFCFLADWTDKWIWGEQW